MIKKLILILFLMVPFVKAEVSQYQPQGIIVFLHTDKKNHVTFDEIEFKAVVKGKCWYWIDINGKRVKHKWIGTDGDTNIAHFFYAGGVLPDLPRANSYNIKLQTNRDIRESTE